MSLSKRLWVVAAVLAFGLFGGFAVGNLALAPAAQPVIAPRYVEPEEPPVARAQAPASQRGIVVPDPNADIPRTPLPVVPPEQRRTKIPVLMYHELGDLEHQLYVRVIDFTAQVRFLQQNGYHPVTLNDLYRHWTFGRPLPPKPVVLTFDDGYRTFWEIAVPLLRQYDFPATLFVVTGLVGKPNYVTWEHVRALPGLGFEVGSHTVTHADLKYLTGPRLTREIAESRTILERETGQRILFFCYPAGRYSDAAVEAVRSAGYVAALTTRYGATTPEQNPLLWNRVRINRSDSLATFAKKLADASN